MSLSEACSEFIQLQAAHDWAAEELEGDIYSQFMAANGERIRDVKRRIAHYVRHEAEVPQPLEPETVRRKQAGNVRLNDWVLDGSKFKKVSLVMDTGPGQLLIRFADCTRTYCEEADVVSVASSEELAKVLNSMGEQ